MSNKGMKMLKRFIVVLEIIVALIIAVAVIMGMPDLFRYIIIIATKSKTISYDTFGAFLKHVLILVVGLEMIMMIITHSHESILTLVLFVIARKMLVYADSMVDIFIGTVSIAIIFFVLKFFAGSDMLLAKYDNTFSAAIPLEKVRRDFGFNIPESDINTLGGLVYKISQDENIKLEGDVTINYGDYKFTIIGYEDGVIERILIEEK